MVNYEDKNWRDIIIKRGQRVASYETLAKELKLSVRQIRTAIKHLKTTGEMTHDKKANFSVVTVNNYDKFQTATDDLTDERQQCKKAKKANKARKQEYTYLPGAETAPDGSSEYSFLLNDQTTYFVSLKQIAKWKELYPAVDIEQELRSMMGWCDANPSKRKTRSGASRFINNWLTKRPERILYKKLLKNVEVSEYLQKKQRREQTFICDTSICHCTVSKIVSMWFLISE